MTTIDVTIRSYDAVTAALPEELRSDRSMGKPLVVELEENARVVDIFTKLPWLANPIEDIVVVFINGEAGTINSTLKAGDTLDIMTP